MAECAVPESSSSGSSSKSTPWLESLKQYVQETNVTTLDLNYMQLKIEEAASVLDLLADTQVCQLDLSCNNLENGMELLSKLLIKTKIRKLKMEHCSLSVEDKLCLMRILKDTQITDLGVHWDDLRADNAAAFFSAFSKSRLTALDLWSSPQLMCAERAASLLSQAIHSNSVTHLNLENCLQDFECSDFLLSLFRNLKHSSITHLNLSNNGAGRYDLWLLGDSFRSSKLLELDLSLNEIDDEGVDALFNALAGSKISTLRLASNDLRGNNSLGRLLSKTQIRKLDLNGNHYIGSTKMFSFPHFLTNSSVELLNLNYCHLSDDIGVKLMKSFKDSKLTSLYVQCNNFEYKSLAQFAKIVKHTSINKFHFSSEFIVNSSASVDEASILFEELFTGSKLTHVNVMGCFRSESEKLAFHQFMDKITNSSVTFLRLHSPFPDESVFDAISLSLINSQLTHLDLSGTCVRHSISSFTSNLKLTSITHLELRDNYIGDEGAKVLAECLKETCIISLNLEFNRITCDGATALALFLKDTVVFNLKLKQNEIGNAGLEALAKNIQDNLITSLDVMLNPGNALIVEKVIWNNRRLVHQLVSAFKRIVPVTINNDLQFEDLAGTSDISKFLEEYLNSYKFVIDQSCVASILAREESITLSRDQITTFLFDTLPQQLTSFIATKIEADTAEQVNFLKKVEGLGLRQIAELLLLNRPLYTVDESHSILHPYIYKLLIKYKLPVCNLNVEPQGIERIIEYFTTFSSIEGASEVAGMLEGMNKAAKKPETSVVVQ